MSLPSIFGMPPNLDLQGGSILPASEVIAEYASSHPDIDFSSLTDIDDIAAYAEQVNLFTLNLPDGIIKASPYQWFKTPSDSAPLLPLGVQWQKRENGMSRGEPSILGEPSKKVQAISKQTITG